MKDKSCEGVKNELRKGLTTAAVYFYQSWGVPLEIFNHWIKKLNNAEKLLWYFYFRNDHLNLFK